MGGGNQFSPSSLPHFNPFGSPMKGGGENMGGTYTPKFGAPQYIGAFMPQADVNANSLMPTLTAGTSHMNAFNEGFNPALYNNIMTGPTYYSPQLTTQYGDWLSANAMAHMPLADSILGQTIGQGQGFLNSKLPQSLMGESGNMFAGPGQHQPKIANSILQKLFNGNNFFSLGPAGGASQEIKSLDQQAGQPLNPTLMGYANEALTQGFDPQGELRARETQRLTDQLRAEEAASGIASTPYGEGARGQVLSDFNLNWLNEQMKREQAAAQTAGGLYQTAEGERMLPAQIAQMISGEQSNWANSVMQDAAAHMGIGTGSAQIGSEMMGAAMQPLQFGLNEMLSGAQTGMGMMEGLGQQIGAGQQLAQAGPSFQTSILSTLLGNTAQALNPTQTAIADYMDYLGKNQAAQQIGSQQNIAGTSALLDFIANMQQSGGGSSGGGKGGGGAGSMLGSMKGGMGGK